MRSSQGIFAGVAAALLLGLAWAGAASAAPVTYNLILTPGSNRVTTIQLVDISPPITATPCGIGLGNCLANAPVAIDSASITLDLATNELIALDIFVSGPMILDLNGLNGYEGVNVNGASYQMNAGPFALIPVGAQYNFAAPGAVSATSVELFFSGNPGPVPDAVVAPYGPVPTTPTGNIQFGPNLLVLTLTGVDLGVFADPLTGGNPVLAKADFVFTAAVPEPDAALLYGVGLLVAGATLRRRAVVRVECR